MVLSNDAPFDLVLTDVVMPWPMGGKALAEALVRRWSGINVLYMSGFGGGATTGHDPLPDDAPLLPKPFGLAQLARAVRDCLDGRD